MSILVLFRFFVPLEACFESARLRLLAVGELLREFKMLAILNPKLLLCSHPPYVSGVSYGVGEVKCQELSAASRREPWRTVKMYDGTAGSPIELNSVAVSLLNKHQFSRGYD